MKHIITYYARNISNDIEIMNLSITQRFVPSEKELLTTVFFYVNISKSLIHAKIP